MHRNTNARLTQKGRLRLVSQHLNNHRPLAELAAGAGISLRCAYKWLARYPTALVVKPLCPIDAVFAAPNG